MTTWAIVWTLYLVVGLVINAMAWHRDGDAYLKEAVDAARLFRARMGRAPALCVAAFVVLLALVLSVVFWPAFLFTRWKASQ